MVFLLFIVLILSSHVSDSSALSESATLRIMKNTQCIYRYIPSLGYKVSVNFSVAHQHHPAFIFSRSQHRPLVDFTVRVSSFLLLVVSSLFTVRSISTDRTILFSAIVWYFHQHTNPICYMKYWCRFVIQEALVLYTAWRVRLKISLRWWQAEMDATNFVSRIHIQQQRRWFISTLRWHQWGKGRKQHWDMTRFQPQAPRHYRIL